MVVSKPSAANPVVACKEDCFAAVRSIAIDVALVTVADVISDNAKLTPASLVAPSRSQTSFDQSRFAFTSVPVAAKVVKFVPVSVSIPPVLL